MRRRAFASGALALGLAAFAPSQSAFVSGRWAAAPTAKAGRVALVLSAGAQFGWAHLGVMRWLEEHRVPVHCVVGTSMGALLGGFYAQGVSPREIEDLAASVDWATALQSTPSYRRLTMRRKEDRRDVPGLLEVGESGLPYGLSSIPFVSLLLSRVALPTTEDTDFDRLVLPYRAVSFDYVNLRAYVPASGSLPLAIRGSISLPLGFTPAITQDRALGDGGIVQVLPVTTAMRVFHPDAVIAVNMQPDVDLDAPEADATPIHHPTGARVLFDPRALNVVGQGNAVLLAVAAAQLREQKRQVRALGERGVWVQPEVPRAVLPWTAWRFYEERGYQAMEAMADRMRPFELNEADWARYVGWREAMRKPRRFTPESVAVAVPRIEGGRDRAAEADLLRGLRPLTGKTLDSTAFARPNTPLRDLEGRLLDAQATGRYEGFDYQVGKDGRSLEVFGTPRLELPTAGRLSPEFRESETLRTLTTARGRLVRYDPLGFGSEARLDLALGAQNALGLELYAPRPRGDLFTAFRLYAEQTPVDVFAGERRVEEARTEGIGLGGDFGVNLDRRTTLRAGLDVGRSRLVRATGTAPLPSRTGPGTFVSLRGTHDGQDRAMVPTRGLRVDATLRYGWAPQTSDGFEGEGTASLFEPIGNGSAFAFGGGGTAFGRTAFPGDFGRVAPLRLSPLGLDTGVGGTYALGGAGYMAQLGQLPEVLGSGNLRLGLWGEWDEAESLLGGRRGGGSVNFGGFLESPVGPVYLGLTNDLWRRTRLRLLLGRLF